MGGNLRPDDQSHSGRNRTTLRVGGGEHGLVFRQGRLYFADALATPSAKVVFPNADDAPAEFAKFTVYALVPFSVGGQFLFPKRAVAGGKFAMLGAAVPKTTIHENRESCLPKKEIRFSENTLMPAPARDFVCAK